MNCQLLRSERAEIIRNERDRQKRRHPTEDAWMADVLCIYGK